MKRLIMVLVLALMGSLTLFVAPAQATNDPEKCYEQVVDVPEHDEVVVIHEAYDEVIPGTPSKWWNFSPNKDQGPFDGPPSFPGDERGTWQGPHTEGGPGQDQVGTYQIGNGNGDWFHREAGTPDQTIHHDAVTETKHVDATYKQVEVPCEEEPPTDVCPDIPGDQPEGTDCTPPPVDVCPELPGNQPEGTDCNPVTPPVDVCPNVPGDQPEGTDCTPPVKPVPKPPTTITTVHVVKTVPDAKLPDTGGAPLALLIFAGVAVAGGITIISTARLQRSK